MILWVVTNQNLFGQTRVIRQIEVQGNKKIESAAVLSKINSRIGSDFSPSLIQQDIRSIFALGYFDEIKVEEEPVENGVRLIYLVHEKAIVAKVDYTGLDALEQDDLKDVILVREYEVLDYHKLNQSVEKLILKYEEKGYYLVDVRHEVKLDEKKNEASVTFIIDENEKVQVKQINIVGNKVISDEDLKTVMQTKEGGPLSWLTGSGAYREAVFERDLQALGFYYGTLGYVRAHFGKPEVTVSADKKWIYISFFVQEGERYFVGKIDFRGELLYKRQELLDECRMVSGEVFNAEMLRQETLRYTDKYSDLGYAFANVVPQPNIHDSDRTVDITFDVEKGDKVYIGKIIVTGNTRTKDKVVRRELKIFEGELFNGTRKRESRENVLRLGFFDSVEFHQIASKDNSNVVDIEVRVKERSTGQLVIGAGYASGDIGFTAQAQLSQNNFLGQGQVASLSAHILTGRKLYEFVLGFHEPYVGYSRWSLGGDVYHQRREVVSISDVKTFEETKTGFDIKLGHPVLEFTNLFITYRLENAYVPHSSIIDRKLIPPESVNGLSSSITASVVYDKRDDRFDPREGLFGSLSSEYAGLGGIQKFIRSRATAKFFHPIIWDFIFRWNLSYANITGAGKEVPINELFISGGLYSLRGYDFFSVGPRAKLSSDLNDLSEDARKKVPPLTGREIVIGGHNELLMNSEIEFPILKEARIRGVLFFDVGNSFNGFFKDTQPALLANFGWGFRWFTPIGPLRFEFGYPIVYPGSAKFYFSIGPPF